MYPDTGNTDTANDSATSPGSITYCQAVSGLPPLAVIEKGNNNLAGIRQIERAPVSFKSVAGELPEKKPEPRNSGAFC
jgi:hypothetical protein